MSEDRSAHAAFVRANLRWNIAVLAFDYGLFGLGLSLAATTTLLPAFAQRLGASNLVIGLLPALLTVGWGLPSIFFANYIERQPRKMPLILWVTVWERVPYLLLGLAALFLAESQPGLTVVAILLLVVVASLSGGAIMPAWMEVVAKLVPTQLRGRFFGLGSIVSGVTGAGGAVLSAHFLGNYAFPLSYALCFFAAFAAFAASFAFLSLTREHPVPASKPAISLASYLRRLPALVRGDRNFAAYLVARLLFIGGTMGNGFYTVYALGRLGAREEQVAIFTLVLGGCQTFSTVLWGQLADRYGNRLVLILGAACGVGAALAALAAADTRAMYGVFALMGFSLGAVNISHMNILLEFSPPADRPTYIGLAGSSLAPVAFLVPVLGGLLADRTGFGAVFGLAGILATLSLFCLLLFVKEPRNRHEFV
ncbi:MAG: MFS transporter [Chloroflexota bacterium]